MGESLESRPTVDPMPSEDFTAPPSRPWSSNFFLPVPAFRVTSEFDSESSLFFHKVSCKFLDRLAKLKFSFHNNQNGKISCPQLGFITKYLSVLYDYEDQNALVRGSFPVGNKLQFRAVQDLKAQQGEVAVVASLADPSYKLELVSSVPSVGLPRTTLHFPLGEVSVEEQYTEEKGAFSLSGIVKGHMLNGVSTALYKDDELNLRYLYKDEQISFIPSISWPSNVVAFAFKRRFSPSEKLSFWYNFDSNYWSAVYKHAVGKDYKFKAGYDSEAKLSWASVWVGDEEGKAKSAPMKMKVQFMLQVPQDDIAATALMFRVKKRWDF